MYNIHIFPYIPIKVMHSRIGIYLDKVTQSNQSKNYDILFLCLYIKLLDKLYDIVVNL